MNAKSKAKTITGKIYEPFKTKVKPSSLMLSCFAYNKIRYLANKADTEIGFWGIGDSDDPLYIKDIVVIKQVASPVYNAFDDSALADFMSDMHEKGHDIDEFAFVWGHTHPAGCGANPSPTDESTFGGEDKFGKKKKLVMFILCQSGEMYARLREVTQFCSVETELKIEVDTHSFQDLMDRCASDPEMVKKWDESLDLVEEQKTATVSTWKTPVGVSPVTASPYMGSGYVSSDSDKFFGKVDDDDDTVVNGPDWYEDIEYDISDSLSGSWGEEKACTATSGDAWFENLFIADVTYDENGDVDSVNEISEEEIERMYGCSASGLEDVFRTLCYDVDSMLAVALIKYCARLKDGAFSKWNLSCSVADILKAVPFKVRKKETISAAVDRFFEKNKDAANILKTLELEAIQI